MKSHRLQDMTWQEARSRLPLADACVLPWGAFEQHGPYLPLSVDSAIATAFSERLIARADSEFDLVVLPTVSYGRSPEHMAFAGTVSLSFEAVREVLHSIARSLAVHGARHLLVVNAHGGNSDSLASQLREVRDRCGLVPLLFDIWRSQTILTKASAGDWHAGRVERSLYAALVGEGRNGKAGAEQPLAADFRALSAVRFPWRADELSSSGVIGDAGEPSAAFGEDIVDSLLDELTTSLSSVLPFESGESKP